MRVLIAEDSPLFAAALQEILDAVPDMEVVGVAWDGEQAVELTRKLSPDVLLVDIMMPIMDGLEAIEVIMATCPTPILAMSSDPRGPDGERIIEALRRGALDLVEKPTDLDDTSQTRALLEQLRLVASITVVRHVHGTLKRHTPQALQPLERQSIGRWGGHSIVALVASTGGPSALAHILERLPAHFNLPIVIVQHMASGFAITLASYLNRNTALSVELASDGALLAPGHVFIAPDEHTMQIERRNRIRLDPIQNTRRSVEPSGTILLRSVARAHKGKSIGVILTGMGSDGAEGLLELREAGGLTFVQSPETCRVASMPRAAIKVGAAEHVLSLDALAKALIEASRR